MKCLDCNSGFCETCYGGDCDCKHRGNTETSEPTETQSDNENDSKEESSAIVKRIRRTKLDASLKDQQSTGRKRAAQLYPLHREENCEWRLSKNMGGGVGIEGCNYGLQQARHHGPDKNTLNNEEGNVHRICHSCHNRWHAKNDEDYDPNKPLKN